MGEFYDATCGFFFLFRLFRSYHRWCLRSKKKKRGFLSLHHPHAKSMLAGLHARLHLRWHSWLGAALLTTSTGPIVYYFPSKKSATNTVTTHARAACMLEPCPLRKYALSRTSRSTAHSETHPPLPFSSERFYPAGWSNSAAPSWKGRPSPVAPCGESR